VSHYRQRELATDHTWKTHSTKVTYQGYLNKWILPRWQDYTLSAINAGEIELWLRSLSLGFCDDSVLHGRSPASRWIEPR
jgi:hypothetical protein